MAILFNNHGGDQLSWYQALKAQQPDMPIHIYPDIPNPNDIRYAIVWGHPFGDLLNYPNLDGVLSLGAGMEHLLNDPDLPDVPLVSLHDPFMSQDMANYALYWTIHLQRQFTEYQQQQDQGVWKSLAHKDASDFKVVLLGLGRIAQTVGQTLTQSGFPVEAWDFTDKTVDGLSTHSGANALDQLLSEADVVVSCLALNERSHQLIDERFLSKMPKGSSLINISRGNIVDEDALLAALDSEHLHFAALDVFAVEPLPADHAFWNHSRVVVTPHMAGPTPMKTSAAIIIDNIRKMERGKTPHLLFDRQRGRQC